MTAFISSLYYFEVFNSHLIGTLNALSCPFLVLSYCQVWGIPAVLYLCYTDVMKLDLVTVEAFKPILSSRSWKGLVKVRV